MKVGLYSAEKSALNGKRPPEVKSDRRLRRTKFAAGHATNGTSHKDRLSAPRATCPEVRL